MLTLLRRFARLLLLIAGFLLVALFIWFAGPLFEFAEYRPLESVRPRESAAIGGASQVA
jgi:type VI protein secretion system component VasK